MTKWERTPRLQRFRFEILECSGRQLFERRTGARKLAQPIEIITAVNHATTTAANFDVILNYASHGEARWVARPEGGTAVGLLQSRLTAVPSATGYLG